MTLPVTITGLSTAVAPIGPFKGVSPLLNVMYGEYFSGGVGDTTIQKSCQSFTTVEAITFSVATLHFGTFNNPTDGAYLEIRSGSQTGPLLATSDVVPYNTMGAVSATNKVRFTFPTPVSLAASTQYFLIAARTGAQSSNYYMWATTSTSRYAGGNRSTFNGSVWTNSSTTDHQFSLGEVDAYYFFGRDSGTATALLAYKTVNPAASNIDTGVNSVGSSTIGASTANQSTSQSFTTSNAFSLQQVTLAIKKTGSPTDQVRVNLYLADANGLPTGSSLGQSAVIALSSVTTSMADYGFAFTPVIALSANTQYCVVVTRSGAIDAANYPSVGGNTSPNYTGGLAGKLTATGWAAETSVTDLRLIVLDPTGWAFIGSKTGFTTALLHLAAYQTNDNIIHILVQDGVAASLVATKYVYYDCSTDTFLATAETVAAAAALTGQAGTTPIGCSIVVRSTGEAVAFYNGVQTKTSGTFRARVYYQRRTSPGVWTAAVQADANTASDNIVNDAVLGDSDRVHFLRRDRITGSHWQRELSNANVLAADRAWTTNTSAISYGQAASYNDAGTIRVAYLWYSGSAMVVGRFASTASATPTVATVTASGYIYGRLFNDGINLHALLRHEASGDLYISSSTDGGAVWTTPTVAFTGTVIQSDIQISFDGNVYQRDNTYTIPYLVNDNGTYKYNERIVSYVAQLDAWDPNNKNTTVTLTNNDKTATVTGAGGGVRSSKKYTSGTAGKYYAEILLTSSAANLIHIGIQDAVSGNTAGNTASIYVRNDTGNIYSGAAAIGYIGGPVPDGSVVCVAWNTETEQIWLRKDNGPWNGNASASPESGIGGIDITGQANVAHALWFYGNASSASAIVRTKLAEFTCVPSPSFSSWFGEPVPWPMLAAGWNRNDVLDNISSLVFSNEDKDVVQSVSNGAGVRGVTSHTAGAVGKYYFEIVITSNLTSGSGVGIAETSATQPVVAGKKFTYQANGSLVSAGTTVANIGVAQIDDVIGFAWNTQTKAMWVRRNEDDWNASATADPATGAGGIIGALASVPFSPLFSITALEDGVSLRANLDSQIYEGPEGFTTWIGEAFVIPDIGVLVASEATIVGSGYSTHHGTGVLTSANVTLINPGGISSSIGTGALTSVPITTRYNSLAYSEEFNQWTQTQITLNPNNTSAPDGQMSADLITDNGVNTVHYVLKNSSLTMDAAPFCTASVYVKRSTLTWLHIRLNDGGGGPYWATFNVDTGALGQVSPNGATRAISYVGDGWYRCSVSFPHGVASLPTVLFCLNQNDGDVTSAPGTGMSCWLWGAQLEFGSAPTAYVPTTFIPTDIKGGFLYGLGTVSWNATGALVAGQVRTNYATRSQEFNDTSAWSPVQVVITANAVPAPDSTTTAERIAGTGVNGGHYVYQTPSSVPQAAGSVTYSVYAKAGTTSWFEFYEQTNSVWAYFDVLNGVVGTKSASVAANIVNAGNGWYRCSLSLVTVQPSFRLFFNLAPRDDGVHPVPNFSNSIYIDLWGAQAESGLVATDYIPTAGSAVTVGTPPSLTAVGEVTTPPAIGTGALTTGIADLDAFGNVRSVGTGVLDSGLPLRTNLILQSQAIGPTAWAATAATLATDVDYAPDGTLTAELLIDNATTNNHYVNQNSNSFVAGAAFTFSIYAKANTLNWLQVYISNGTHWANFDLSTGVIGNKSSAGCTPAIVSVGNGWYRCSVSGNSVSAGSGATFALLATSNFSSLATWLGTGTGAVAIWGAQLERGSVATAYIPTTSAPVTVGGPAVLAGTGITQVVATGSLVSQPPLRTNYATNSEQINLWGANLVLYTPDDILAPNSTLTAEKIADLGTSSGERIISHNYNPGSLIIGRKYAISFYLKAGTCTWVKLQINTNVLVGTLFNLAAGTVGNTNQCEAASITDVGGGWYRVSITHTAGADSGYVNLALAPNGDQISQNFVGTNGGIYIHAWGAQVEEGAVPSAYIPTTSAAVPVPGSPIFGAGTSSSRQTSSALQAAMLPLQLGTGRSSSEGTGTLTSNTAAASGAGLGPSWVGIGTLTPTYPLSGGNLLKESQAFDSATWLKSMVTVTANAVTAPDGQTTAERIADTGANGNHYVQQTAVQGVKTGLNTYSVHVKAGSGAGWFCLSTDTIGSQWANFNAITGAKGLTQGTVISTTVTTLADGWYRFSITVNPASLPGNAACYVLLLPSDTTTPGYSGSGSYIHVWGAQWEPGATANTYIPTTSAPFYIYQVLAGTGTSAWSGAGVLPGTIASVAGSGLARWMLTGAMFAQPAITVSPGVSSSEGSGILPGTFSALAGIGQAVTGVGGIGAFQVQSATLTSVGGLSQSFGTGTLTQAMTLAGSGQVTAIGSGALPILTKSLLASVGTSQSFGTGVLTTTANLTGLGLSRWVATGTLPAGVTSLIGSGTARWVATGTLPAGTTLLTSVGTSRPLGTAPLQASLAYVSGFEGVSVVSGMGALQAQSRLLDGEGGTLASGTGSLVITTRSILASSGASQSVGTGALTIATRSTLASAGAGASIGSGAVPAQAASLTAIGGVRWLATGTLPAASTTAVGVGTSRSFGTGVLPVQPTAISSIGVAISQGTAVLPAGTTTLAGTGTNAAEGTAVLAAASGTILGSGDVRHVIPATALASAVSAIVSSGLSSSRITSAALQSSLATVQGLQGVMIGTGTGDLQAQSRLAVGVGTSRSFGSGILVNEDTSLIADPGVSQSFGTGVLPSSPTVLEGEGDSKAFGPGVLLSKSTTISSTGISQWLGTGELLARMPGLAGVGATQALGTGALLRGPSALEAEGFTQSKGSGVLTSGRATIFGTAFLTTGGFGDIVEPDHKLTGAGLSRTIGAGVLVQGRPDFYGDGLTGAVGTGTVVSRRALMLGFGEETNWGSGVLTSRNATISANDLIFGSGALVVTTTSQIAGEGIVQTPTYPPPTPLPGSYPGTTTWGGYGTLSPPELPRNPWWIKDAA